MSFWNEDTYKVKLSDFIERFVAHNSVVKLYTMERIKNEEGIWVNQYDQVWKGMDWQITEGYINKDYFETHPEVLPCPYSEANVVKIMNIGHVATISDEVSLVIDEIPFRANKKPETKSYKPNTVVTTTDGELKFSC